MSVYFPHGFSPSTGIDITYGDDLAIVLLQESFDVTHPHTAQADYAHRQTAARGRAIAPAEKKRRDNIRHGNGWDGTFQKNTP
jgi:hypothetical protein